jgi:hypothetical protein
MYCIIFAKKIIMQKIYVSSEKRLVKYFEGSRNKWKNRSTENQSAKRFLQSKLRDSERAKEKWKKECIELRKEVSEFKKKHQLMMELTQLIME